MTRKLKGYGNASSSGNVVVLDRFEVDEIGRVWRHNKRVRF